MASGGRQSVTSLILMMCGVLRRGTVNLFLLRLGVGAARVETRAGGLTPLRSSGAA
jgi:hypothetical protein